jgi:hypothetical protein
MPTRAACGLFIVALVVAACGTPAATDAPTDPTTPASPAATPTPTATESPSASPVAATLEVDWRAEDLTGIGDLEWIVGVARAGDAYVLVGSLPSSDEDGPSSAAWWSPDGTAWELATEFPVGDTMYTMTAGGPGFVVAGESDDGGAVWTSTDGREWQSVTDSSLDKAVISQLVATNSGLVGFGSRSNNSDDDGIWTSSDGVEWLAATNESGLAVAEGLQAVASYDGRAIAFVSEGDEQPPTVWETTGRAEWTRTGVLPDMGTVERVAGGARGWVALGENRAWTSADGTTWSDGVPGPDVSADVIVDDAGYVAVGSVGSLPGETCGDQRPFAGHTWTSSDGSTWAQMPVTTEFEGAMVTNLLVVDRTLVGYGLEIAFDPTEAFALPVAQWTDTLPDLTTPVDASDEASVPQLCGG